MAEVVFECLPLVLLVEQQVGSVSLVDCVVAADLKSHEIILVYSAEMGLIGHFKLKFVEM